MIRKCEMKHLERCVEIAYRQNQLPESECAFCSKSREGIYRDFASMSADPHCFMAGHFSDEGLLDLLGIFVNPENQYADCIGPFFSGEWDQETAVHLFQFAKESLPNAKRFNFFFNAQNANSHCLMAALDAKQQDNEYIFLLEKAAYVPQKVTHCVVKYTVQYEQSLVRLHDETFPEVYVNGHDIVASIGGQREVFCALDDAGAFVGYGVLKLADHGSSTLTAEIFAVQEEQRGRGYGWALLNAVVDSAFAHHNASAVHLVVEKLNARAQALYHACGFVLMVENESFCIRA